MNIGTLYRMFKNLKSSTLVIVTNINVQDEWPVHRRSVLWVIYENAVECVQTACG